MKRILALSALIAMPLVTGCGNTQSSSSLTPLNIVLLDSTKRAPTIAVDIFSNGETPKRPFKEIGEFSVEGGDHLDGLTLKLFVSEGKKIGAQAIVTEKHVSRVVQHGDFGRDTFCEFNAMAAVYE